ncbi:hypothetical protein L484_003837 [Morus notabilis]|uniref:Probable purine permease n=1 Tax=Morus notabilis TaxID=981085 RepID=W9QP89_9ROSA|nr:probable purine permease 10 [Morus notabilis]EXB45753.1 hypothetical protein L484_003837 [Morus notabilis]
MGEAQVRQPSVTAQEANDANPDGHTNGSINQSPNPQPRRKLTSWIRIGIYAVFVLAGQSAGNLLGKLYYDKGGNSTWIGSFLQVAGFPILLPYYLLPSRKNNNTRTEISTNTISSKSPSIFVLASFYMVLGLILAADCYFYSLGLMYLPVSTYSLLCASQLAFNALFSFFLNSQKFTFYIINSLVLLTTSSILLVFQSESEDTPNISKGKYVIGFICTVGACAGYGLVLSLTQFLLNRILKSESLSAIVDIIVFRSLVASLGTLVGLFASGEWKVLDEEMNSFRLGKLSYVMTLAWIAITWKLFSIGSVGLIAEVSSLFSNGMSVSGFPIVPILAVFFFHEKMDGIKVMAMLLAIWGFTSYVYQKYLDDYGSRKESQNAISETRTSPHREREINV